MNKEEKYISKRKRQAKRLSALFLLMRVFPIKKKKIVFAAFEGDGGFGCNPRYIAEELHKRSPLLEMVWLTHDITRPFPDYIHLVKDTPLNTAYHLSTAKVWVDNYRKPYGTLKRNGQLYIQTWHATIGFKAVGLFRGDAFPKIARLVSEWDSSLVDYCLSNSKYCDDVYPKKLLYNGPTLRVGSPRVDTLINDREKLHIKLREDIGLDRDVKLLLFAPTFRSGNQQGKRVVAAETPQIDFDKLIEALRKRFGGDWRILLRLHPTLAARLDEMPLLKKNPKLIDVSTFPDISQILGGCEMLITDYSSCAFDAAFAHIPVLLYADDVQEYIKERGKFMWKREELPFDIAESNEALMANVRAFDEERYNAAVDFFMEEHEVVEDGKASERITTCIECFIGIRSNSSPL